MESDLTAIKNNLIKHLSYLLLLVILTLGCRKSEFTVQSEEWLFYHDFETSSHKWQTVYTLLDQPSKNNGLLNVGVLGIVSSSLLHSYLLIMVK
jgi:hypothetical protein